MLRTEMLPLNWKPWFPDSNHECTLCNLKVNENIEHFVKICPILKEFRSKNISDCNIINILNGGIDWKVIANFISLALNYRTQLIDEFN